MSARRVLSAVCCSLLMGTVQAQRTLIVDQAGGAGSQFRTIGAAVAAANPGDIVIVRVGDYNETVLVEKGLHLIGQRARLRTDRSSGLALTVRDIPGNQTFTMLNFEAGPQAQGPTWIEVRNCRGLVSLQDLNRTSSAEFGLAIAFSDNVHVARATLALAHTHDSRVVYEQSSFPTVRPAMSIGGGDIEIASCDLSTSLGLAGPGIIMGNARVSIANSTIDGNAGDPAIQTSGGELTLDPTTILRSSGPLITGNAVVRNREISSTTTSLRAGVLAITLTGKTNADFAIVASPPSPVLTTPFGNLWLDRTTQGILDFGTLANRRTHRWSTTYPPTVPAGLTITVQSVLYDGTFSLSAPSVVVFP